MKILEKHGALHTRALAAAAAALLSACQPDPEPPVTGDAYDDAPATAGEERPAPASPGGQAPGEPGETSAAEATPAGAPPARAELEARSDSDVAGTLELDEESGILRIRGEITGLTPGVHGLHVHEAGDCSAPDASSAGEHFAPQGEPHGAPTQTDAQHHAGDLGNIVADSGGVASIDVIDDTLSLSGSDSVVGRALVVHSQADDLTSQPAGNAGDRVGCGVIELAAGTGAG